MRGRRIRRGIFATIALLGLGVALFMGFRLETANFGTVVPGRIYRSGQMSSRLLARTVREQKIKTVINLRGSNPKDSWYRDEKAASLNEGATQVDIHMASDLWLSRDQARTLLKVLDTSAYPILIHCQWGAERTGLVSALTELLRPGGTLESARQQFSLYYLYVPAGDGVVMEQHLGRYADWLRSQKLSHSPENCRKWLTAGYKPGHPSREDWPYDPYPLVIVSESQAKSSTPSQASSQALASPTVRK